MKIRIFLIAIPIVATSVDTLNGMSVHKETMQRLGAQMAADCKNEDPEGLPQNATTESNKSSESKKVPDPVTQAIHQSIEKQKAQEKFNAFFVDFKRKADAIWKDRKTTKDKIINEYVTSLGNIRIDKDNKHSHAAIAQSKIDEHYQKEYAELYQKTYSEHFGTQSPSDVTQCAVNLVYAEQKNECCVIL